ncbi:MAG: hypothetical protein QM784_09715 [Polyangiaceae bacterium]
MAPDNDPSHMRFTEVDRQIVNRLVYDPTCEPSYELMKACLVWSDERPTEISHDGYSLLCDLWIVRGFLHKNRPFEKWGLDPTYFQAVWSNGLIDVPLWPGFRRLELSEKHRDYLLKSDAEASQKDFDY